MRCSICYLPINERTTVVLCPHCRNEFHRDHLAGWLLKNEHCPMCRDTFPTDFRDQLRPKSERERRRLERIMRTLDGVGELLKDVEKKHERQIMEKRREEFGIERTTFGDIFKIAIPVILFLGFLITLYIAFTSTA